jgi:(p)ppGpp synthase/HD superfamily hydrolase
LTPEEQHHVQERIVLYGVDVTNSHSFKHPEVLRAVEFAAEAHMGQFRKTGEPYVSHCIEAALIVENMLPPVHQNK